MQLPFAMVLTGVPGQVVETELAEDQQQSEAQDDGRYRRSAGPPSADSLPAWAAQLTECGISSPSQGLGSAAATTSTISRAATEL